MAFLKLQPGYRSAQYMHEVWEHSPLWGTAGAVQAGTGWEVTACSLCPVASQRDQWDRAPAAPGDQLRDTFPAGRCVTLPLLLASPPQAPALQEPWSLIWEIFPSFPFKVICCSPVFFPWRILNRLFYIYLLIQSIWNVFLFTVWGRDIVTCLSP